MKRFTLIGLLGLAVLLLLLVAGWSWQRSRPAAPAAGTAANPPQAISPIPGTVSQPGPPARARPPEAATTKALSVEEKQARIDKIKKDYDDIRARTSAEYSAAGAAFPGGLNAFLRQLALLEREKRTDLAAVLTPAELEDLELRETPAGQLVSRLLGDAALTDGQRRTAFRLQRDFEDHFGLTYNVTPRGLYEREAARQGLQEQIKAVIGHEALAAWLRGEGDDYAKFAAFAAQQNLPADAAVELWRAKNDFTLQRLELLANPAHARSPDQLRAAQAALTHQMEARVLSIVGPGLMDRARAEVLGWLPKKW